jgi:DNA-binding LacI/PurR family transcriptional regulator
MADVARIAGVSHQTVSRVINEVERVRPATRARVRAAIDQLGYLPNVAARALATGRTRTLGVVTFDSRLYGPASTLHGIEQASRAEGYFVTMVSLSSIDPGTVRDAVGRLVAQGVDGVILDVPLVSALGALDQLSTDVPMVAVEGDPLGGIPVVSVDQVDGARQATEHLLDAGHDTVWHVAGPKEWLETHGRIAGWRAALGSASVEVPPLLHGDWSARSGYEAGRVLASIDKVTAVFVANDQMALGVMRALHENGRAVPTDVSVVGFDDIPEAGYVTPALTTVRQDFDLVGRNGLQLMIDQINSGRRQAQALVVKSRLVVRESSGPARTGRA